MIKINFNIWDGIKDEYFEIVFKKISKHFKDFKLPNSENNIKYYLLKHIGDKSSKKDLTKQIKHNLNKKISFNNLSKSLNINLCIDKKIYTEKELLFAINLIFNLFFREDRNNKNNYSLDEAFIKDLIMEKMNALEEKYSEKAFIENISKPIDLLSSHIVSIFINYNYLNKYKHKLLYESKIYVCPYCNRQFISGYMKDNIKKTTADLDHFYPKSSYPFFALTLFNFIPSCKLCNQNFKGSKSDFWYLYDTECDNTEHLYFDIDFKKTENASIVLAGKSDDFEINLISNSIKKIKLIKTLKT